MMSLIHATFALTCCMPVHGQSTLESYNVCIEQSGAFVLVFSGIRNELASPQSITPVNAHLLRISNDNIVSIQNIKWPLHVSGKIVARANRIFSIHMDEKIIKVYEIGAAGVLPLSSKELLRRFPEFTSTSTVLDSQIEDIRKQTAPSLDDVKVCRGMIQQFDPEEVIGADVIEADLVTLRNSKYRLFVDWQKSELFFLKPGQRPFKFELLSVGNN